jgi:hypothetical protein
MQPPMMTNLPESLRRLAAVLLLACLAACGPGTGGTGTGPIHTPGSFSTGASMAIAPPDASCLSQCEQVQLLLQEQRVELLATCRRFVFSGDWVVDGNGLAVLQGTLETRTAAGSNAEPATLRLQFNGTEAASTQVGVQLGGESTPAAAPVVLQRDAPSAAALAPACAITPS